MTSPTAPAFDVKHVRGVATVYLLCSFCRAIIREMSPNEQIRVDRAYFCRAHDPGRVISNPPRRPDEEETTH